MADEEYIWKIKHKPTGLFYCSKKGRWKDQITNLSQKGNHYTSAKIAVKVANDDLGRAKINKAQATKHGIPADADTRWGWATAKKEDFEIEKYKLVKA